MIDDPSPTTPPPGAGHLALTDDELDSVIALVVNRSLGEEDAARLLATLDEARSEIMRLQDDGSAYDVGYQRADAAAGVALDRLRQERDEACARAAHFERLAKDQQATNAAMVASLKRGLAQLEASEAERARLRDDCAALLKILDATYDGPLGRFTRDRIGEEIHAALAAMDRGRAPSVEHEPACLLGKYGYAGCRYRPAGEAAGNG